MKEKEKFDQQFFKETGIKAVKIKGPIKIPEKDAKALADFLIKKRKDEERINKKIIEGKI